MGRCTHHGIFSVVSCILSLVVTVKVTNVVFKVGLGPNRLGSNTEICRDGHASECMIEVVFVTVANCRGGKKSKLRVWAYQNYLFIVTYIGLLQTSPQSGASPKALTTANEDY